VDASALGGPVHALPATAPAATEHPVTERRHVSVSFCDLVGSTELSSRIDAEEFSDLIQAYHECAVGVAQRFGGQVDHYSSDGINFVFGWPVAHDDDAERAVRCSLEIIRAMSTAGGPTASLAVRVGVHSGLVVVGEMGASAQRSVMALGETMNVAARLQNEASPGTVVISRTTMKAVGGIFVTEPMGARRLKGIAHPVEAFRVLRPSGVRGRLDAARGRLTPFVGRQAEQSEVIECWQQVLGGHGRAVLIGGEAGVGKSRLIYELRNKFADTSQLWLECGGSSYTQGSVLRPAIDLLLDGLRVRRDDHPAVRFEKIREGLAASGLDSTEAAEISTALLSPAAVEEDAELKTSSRDRRGRRTIEVLVDWLLALSRLQPTVLFVEDVHWCDEQTVQLLREVATRCTNYRLLLVMTARPEFAAWPDEDTIRRIQLSPVNPAESRQIIETLAGERTLPEPVIERILAATGGIPLFVEEVTRTAFEAGDAVPGDGHGTLANLSIPTTLQGSLMARLDRLGHARAVAQTASVIGREFTFELLSEIADVSPAELETALGRLFDSDLIFQSGSPPQASYAFKHVLVQEVAYDSLLRRTRRTMHRRIADCLRQNGSAGTSVALEVIARHYDAAGQIVDAIEFYRRAGMESAERSGFKEAIAHLQRSIELTGLLPAGKMRDRREIELQLAHGSAVIAAHGYANPATESAYRRVQQLCDRRGDEIRGAEAMAGLSIFYTNRGQIDKGAAFGAKVLAIGVARHDDSLELLGCVQVAHPRLYQCRVDESLRHALRALAIYDPERHRHVALQFGTDHGVAAHIFAGWSRMMFGAAELALDHLDQATQLATMLEQPFNLSYALCFQSTLRWMAGDHAGALASASEARRLGLEQGFDLLADFARILELSDTMTLTADRSLVPELLARSLDGEASGNLGGSPCVLARMTEALCVAGDVATAHRVLASAFAISVHTGQPWWDSELYRLRGELAIKTVEIERGESTGRVDEVTRASALDDLRHAIGLAVDRRFPFHELRARSSLVRLMARSGSHRQAVADLRAAVQRFVEGSATPAYHRALGLLEASSGSST
jgi:class 3 adenylate cyclase/tetratricopeptide (TPR) repeat protein